MSAVVVPNTILSEIVKQVDAKDYANAIKNISVAILNNPLCIWPEDVVLNELLNGFKMLDPDYIDFNHPELSNKYKDENMALIRFRDNHYASGKTVVPLQYVNYLLSLGSPTAQYLAGKCLINARSVTPETANDGVNYIRAASNAGCVLATYAASLLVPQEPKYLELRTAADHGHVMALVNIAEHNILGERPDLFGETLTDLINIYEHVPGFSQALNITADKFITGKIYVNTCSPDLLQSRALAMHEAAATLGNAKSMCSLGAYYSSTGKDVDKSFQFYLAAAKAGYIRGYDGLGRLYLNRKDYVKAVLCFSKAITDDGFRNGKLISDAVLGLTTLFPDEPFVTVVERVVKNEAGVDVLIE